MYNIDRIAAIIKPTEHFLKWLKSTSYKDEALNLEDIQTDCSIVLIPDFEDITQASEFIEDNYEAIFENELLLWNEDNSDWPEVLTLDSFYQWFDVHFHTMVLDATAPNP